MNRKFYDQLAPYYQYLYPDWDSSLTRQGEMLDSVIRSYLGAGAQTVLDAACGIGTQSIGLAKLGYRVTASDLSPGEIQIAKQEARARDLEIPFSVADMREIRAHHRGPFDVVIACDNALPHLLTEEEILQALIGFRSLLNDGGGCLVSVRDYASIPRGDDKQRIIPRRVRQLPEGRMFIFDLWEFEGDTYQISIYFVQETGQKLKVSAARGGRYLWIEIPALERLFLQAGFSSVVTLREDYFQPLLVGIK